MSSDDSRMPEGWKRLNESESAYDYDLYYDGLNKEACELMKEMVEALETYSDACHKGYGRDIKPIDDVLKKFKDWK